MPVSSIPSSSLFSNGRFCSKTKNRADPPPPTKSPLPNSLIMFRAIKRVFIWLGLMAEKSTETDAINQAVVERGIRDSKVRADKTHYANGQLAGQVALLNEQIKRQQRQREDLQGML